MIVFLEKKFERKIFLRKPSEYFQNTTSVLNVMYYNEKLLKNMNIFSFTLKEEIEKKNIMEDAIQLLLFVGLYFQI